MTLRLLFALAFTLLAVSACVVVPAGGWGGGYYDGGDYYGGGGYYGGAGYYGSGGYYGGGGGGGYSRGGDSEQDHGRR